MTIPTIEELREAAVANLKAYEAAKYAAAEAETFEAMAEAWRRLPVPFSGYQALVVKVFIAHVVTGNADAETHFRYRLNGRRVTRQQVREYLASVALEQVAA